MIPADSQVLTAASPRKPEPEWLRKRMREIEKESLQKRRDEIAAMHAEMRRIEEQTAVKVTQMVYDSAVRRAQTLGGEVPMPVQLRAWRLLVETVGTEVPLTPRARAFRAHVDTLLKELNITASWAATPAINGYAFLAARRIECPPIVSAWSAATAYHEAGHIIAPCRPAHARRTTATGKILCVRCELNAWTFATERALEWCLEMHACLDESLATYAQYATAAEAREIEWMRSRRGFQYVEIQRAAREVQRV